jgi:hypothetical protein
MQQRQPRLGDILDDYCPRERRLTNHVVVAMIGETVKQTRCTTCDADHEYKHAAVPRQRKKSEQSALYAQVLSNASPKKVVPAVASVDNPPQVPPPPVESPAAPVRTAVGAAAFEALFQEDESSPDQGNEGAPVEEGPAHRRLIRAQLPRHEGQVSTTRQAPDFTIWQPANGRPRRFGGRPHRGGVQVQSSRQGGGGNVNGNARGGGQRSGGRSGGPRQGHNRPGGGRNRSK